MKIDVRTLRRDAEKIEDSTQRQEALGDLASLENAEFNLQRRLAEINRMHWEKHHAYKPQSKFKLASFASLFLLGSIAGIVVIFDILVTGSHTLSKSQRIVSMDENPIAYWLPTGFLVLGILAALFMTLFFVRALIKYPQPPFGWMSRQRTF